MLLGALELIRSLVHFLGCPTDAELHKAFSGGRRKGKQTDVADTEGPSKFPCFLLPGWVAHSARPSKVTRSLKNSYVRLLSTEDPELAPDRDELVAVAVTSCRRQEPQLFIWATRLISSFAARELEERERPRSVHRFFPETLRQCPS